MQFRGLPPAKTVQQAIVLAQLQILRKMREGTQLRGSRRDGDDGQEEPVTLKSAERPGTSRLDWLKKP